MLNKKASLLKRTVLFSIIFGGMFFYREVLANELEIDLYNEVHPIYEENRKVAYLTFDDGPSIYTEALLEVLNKENVPGIFFVLGSQIENLPNSEKLLQRIISEGHYIALHTMTHDRSALYRTEKSPSLFTKEMFELRTRIKEITGQTINLCRAPYGKKGNFKAAHYKTVLDEGLYCVDWHVDSKDWNKKNAAQIYQEVESQLASHDKSKDLVILFHEYQRTVDVMPRIIELLKDNGYSFEPYYNGKIFDGLD